MIVNETIDTTSAASHHGSRRRRWIWPALIVGVVGVAVVLFWFQPQKLLIDEHVDEAAPDIAAGSHSDGAASPAADVTERARGDFVSLDHGTDGVARVLELDDGSRVLRLEALATDNGPDLFVYLSANPVDGDEGAFDDEFVNLGRLKGNRGDQNYDLPASVDLARYPTVVVWCDRFNSAFGAAHLRA